MQNRRICLFLTVVALYSQATYAQTEKEIVARYTAALKRSKNDDEFKTAELRGHLEVQRLKFPFILYARFPNIMRMEMAFQDAKFLSVSNDTITWDFDPINNSNKIVWRNQDSQKNNSLNFICADLIKYKELRFDLKLLGIEQMDSLQVYKLQLNKDKQGKKQTIIFINTANNLIYKIEHDTGYSYFANYVTKNDFIFPRFLVDSNPSQTLEMHLNDLTFNHTIPDSLFLIPQSAIDEWRKQNALLKDNLASADSLHKLGLYKAAVEKYDQYIQTDKKSFTAYNKRGLSKLELREYYESISDFSNAIELDSGGASAYNNRGLAKYYIGDQAGALKDYNTALSLDSTLLAAYKNRGLTYFKLQKYDSAVNDYSIAVRLKPTDGDSHYNLGITLAQVQKYEEAISHYKHALDLKHSISNVNNHMGVSQYHLGLFEEARLSFSNAVKADPENIQFIDNLGRTLYELGEILEAKSQFEKYLLKKDDNPDVHNFLGLCKYSDDDYFGAVKCFSKSIELNQNNATYFDNRAAAKEKLEDYVGAIDDYSASIKIYPNDPSVFYKRGLVKILTSKIIEGCNDLGTAYEMDYEPAKEAILANCNKN